MSYLKDAGKVDVNNSFSNVQNLISENILFFSQFAEIL